MHEIDLDTIIKIMCCHTVRVEGDKKTIEGDPNDLCSQYKPQVFIKLLDYYLQKDKVEVKLKKESEYTKLESAYNGSSKNEGE